MARDVYRPQRDQTDQQIIPLAAQLAGTYFGGPVGGAVAGQVAGQAAAKPGGGGAVSATQMPSKAPAAQMPPTAPGPSAMADAMQRRATLLEAQNAAARLPKPLADQYVPILQEASHQQTLQRRTF